MAADNDFKHILQDFGNYYIGARWTYREMMGSDQMPFKWKAVIAHYFSKAVDLDTRMEDHIFFMDEEDFAYQTYKELKARFRMSVWMPADPKRRRGGHYESCEYRIEEIVASRALHEQMDTIIVQELRLPKLALMNFSV